MLRALAAQEMMPAQKIRDLSAAEETAILAGRSEVFPTMSNRSNAVVEGLCQRGGSCAEKRWTDQSLTKHVERSVLSTTPDWVAIR